MIHLYPTKKLMNFSDVMAGTVPFNETGNPDIQQWYAGVAGTGFIGGFFVLYVHSPSLLTVITKGETIEGTLPMFRERLFKLLKRFSFPEGNAINGILDIDDYLILEPENTRMISQVYRFSKLITYKCSKQQKLEDVDINEIEDKLMCNTYLFNCGKEHLPPLAFWENKLGFVHGADKQMQRKR